MKASQLLDIIQDLKDLTENTQKFPPGKHEKFSNELSLLEKQFANIEIAENHKHILDAVCQKGKDTVKIIKNSTNAKENRDKLELYLRYLKAAKGDFEGKTNEVGKYYRTFIITTALFLALSPQYFGFILPAVFFVPIFLGMRGVKSRSQNGLYMSLAVVPVGLMTSFIWIRYGIYAVTHYGEAVATVMADTGRSLAVSKALVAVPPLLSLLLLACALLTLYRGYKSKDLFI
ncbi:MAG: hypothetical protein ACOYVK_16040 [Bacillota bacterium]